MPTHRAERWSFIKAWLIKNSQTSALDSDFHEAFHCKFPQYKRFECFWGAQTVNIAMVDLSEMYKSGIVDRGRVLLEDNWQPGFPKWVYSYFMRGVSL